MLQLVQSSRNVLKKVRVTVPLSSPIFSLFFFIPFHYQCFLEANSVCYPYHLSLKFLAPINLIFLWIIPTFFSKILILSFTLGLSCFRQFSLQVRTCLFLWIWNVEINSMFYNVLITILTGYWDMTVARGSMNLLSKMRRCIFMGPN